MLKINSARAIKLIFFVFGFSFLFFLIKKIGLQEIIKAASGAKINFLIYGFIIYLTLILTRAFKWFLMIRRDGTKIGFIKFLPFYFVNCLLGNITPFKTGEAGTPLLMQKYLGIPVGRGLSVVILDRFFELVIFALIFLTSIVYIMNAGIATGIVSSVLKWALAFFTLLIFFLLVVIISKKTSLRILNFFSFLKKYSFPKKLLEFAEKELHVFYDGLSLFREKKVYKFIIPITIICWFFELFSYYLIISSVLPASFLDIATAQIVAIVATIITFIPMGIGIGELGTVYVLKAFGYSAVLSATGVLLARFFLTGTLLGVGVIGTLLLKAKTATKDSAVSEL